MRVLVCGSRDWLPSQPIFAMLNGIRSTNSKMVLIEGGAKGADDIAAKWAEMTLKPEEHLRFEAKWDEYEPKDRWRAGHDRNRLMLEEGKPTLVLAFKDDFNWKMDNGGTENMVRIAKEAKVKTYVIQGVR